MSRARTLADFISTGVGTGILADGAIDSTEITGVTVSSAEINRLAGVSGDVQTQINTKAATSSLAAVATSGAASDVSGLGTAATLNVGTAANNIPQLDSNAKLPAIDGSQLTGLGVTQGTLTKTFTQNETADITLSSSITSGCPVVSATKEVPQTGISTKGNWDVNSTASNYDFHNTAANVTLTPSTTGYDISSLSYDNKSITTSVGLNGVAISSDGTKIYYVANSGYVYQRTLSTAFDISTAGSETSYNHSSQDTSARDITFKTDGYKMYVTGDQNNRIFQYSLNTAWDVTTASYDNKSFDVSNQTSAPNKTQFKSDGTKMYIKSSSRIYEYNLSTAWDVTTVSYTSNNFSLTSQDSDPKGMFLKPDGTKMYVVGANNDKVFEYNFGTAWDLSTFSYSNISSTSFNSTNPLPFGITFSSDGTKMYLVDNSTLKITQYSTATEALALGSGSFASTDVGKRIVGNGGDVVLTSTGGAFSTTGGSAFTDNSTIAAGSWSMFGLKSAGDASGLTIAGVTGSAYDFANATLDTTGSIANNLGNSLTLSPDGTKAVFSLKSGGSTTTAKFGSYSMSTPYDLTTLSETSTAQKPLASTSSFVNDDIALAFNPQGTYAVGVSNESHRFGRYSLSTAWDMSTATASFEQDIGSSYNFTAVLFNGDGSKIYVAELNNQRIYEFNLNNAYAYSAETSSSNSYTLNTLGASSHINYIYHMNWNSDGTKLFFGDNNKLLSVELTTAYSLQHINNSTTQVVYTDNGKLSSIAVASDGTHLIYGQSNQLNVNSYSLQDLTQPTGQYHVAVTNAGGRIDSQYFTDINSMTAAQSAGTGTVHYAVSTDGRTTWSVAKGTDGVRPIVRNNSGTWQYNNDGGTTSVNTNISSATYSNKSFSTANQSGNVKAVSFTSDGTKMYVAGGANVYQYNLSTAFDVSTASYSNYSLNLSSVDNTTEAFFIKPDGTKAWFLGRTADQVRLINFSTAGQLNTASISSDNFSVNSQEGSPTGLWFKPDGTKMYVVGTTYDKVSEYTLSTAWDVTTASFTTDVSVASQDSAPNGVAFNSTGTKMYVSGEITSRVHQYNLTTAWDVSSASYASHYLDALSQDSNIQGISIGNNDGTFYVAGDVYNSIFQYTNSSNAYSTSATWVNGTTNDELYTLQQALGAQSHNRMDKTQLDAVADANHFTLGNSLDLMIALRMDTAASSLPTSDGVTLNYDAAALNEGAVLGTDYDFFFPANNKVQIKSLAAQNLKVRVV